jgi:hypothetical protein
MPKKLYTWRIFRIKGTPAFDAGTVEAPDAETAIRIAIKKLNITNSEQQKRLMAQRRD